jgi:ABC-type dipeptide/oligopeptide/nickel transport system permease component
MLYLILSFVISTALVMLAFTQTRNFVTRRLRYVDAVQSALAPWIAGLGAAAISAPILGWIPIFGVGTALSIGLAVGLGVASGAREVRHTLPRY